MDEETTIRHALRAVVEDALLDTRWLKLDGPMADLARALREERIVEVHEERDGFFLEADLDNPHDRVAGWIVQIEEAR